MFVDQSLKRIITIFFVTLLSFFSHVHAAHSNVLSLHGLFSDHAVLQRGVEVPVWGTAVPGATVDVTFSGQNFSTTADSEGHWMVKLAPLVANATGGTMTVTSAGLTETRVDILVGEVWLASGQSNMAMAMFVADSFNPPSSIPEPGEASRTPSVRLLQMKVGGSSTFPSEDLSEHEKWKLSDRTGVYSYSAVAFYFARALNQALDVPVGIITGTAGGTSIRRWIPESAIQADSCSESLSSINYNYSIAPLLPYALKGVIWYQGEANANYLKVDCYHDELKSLIEGWRSEWAIAANSINNDFPFYFVQLPNFEANENADAWVQMREQMLNVSLDIAETGMAVTIDVGDPNDVHPRLKLPVGERLARFARAFDYGENIVYSGPLYKSLQISGNTAILSFDHIGSGLTSSDGQPLKYFEVAGSDGNYHNALAIISNNTVHVSSNLVPSPVKVRYAWHTNPENPNFSNQEGLMATPFRTDAEFWNGGVSIQPPPVSNVAPVAINDTVGPIEAGGTVSFIVTGNDVDSDNNLNPAFVEIVSFPNQGIATVNESGMITYTHTGSTSTTDILSYTVQDTEGAISNAATVSIVVANPTVNNEIPVAQADTATVQAGGSVAINVLGNDSDTDGTLDKGSLTVVGVPNAGSVDIDTDTGEITYTHDGSVATNDSFTYTIADDQGGGSNEASVSISISSSVASCGKGLELDGINDWLNIPDLTLSGDFTIEGWFKLAPGIDYKDGLFGQEGSGPDIHFSAGRVRLYAYGIRVTANTPLEADTWGHLAITRSGSVLTVYVNGVKDATGSWNGSLSIKAIGRGNKGFVKGMLDEIRVWNVARTGTEISASYTTDVDSNSSGLIGYWQFNDADQTITDASSSANHGSLGASTAVATDDPVYLDATAPVSENCDGGSGNTGGVANVAPVANNDTAGLVEAGGTLNFTVTDNDTDSDDNLDPASVVIVSGPGNGSATVNATGAITYTNTGTIATTDTLSYTVADTEGAISNQATVSITVTEPTIINTAPLANNDTLGPIEAGGTLSFTVTDNDTDNDGNLNPASVVIVSPPVKGTATVDVLGTISYTSTGTAATTDTLRYIVADAEGAISNEATVSITITSLAASCGKGVELDGSNDWINIPDIVLNNDFTVEGWVKLAVGIDNKDALFGQEGSGPDINFYAGKVRLYSGGDKVIANTAVMADTWNHIAITRSGTNLTLYINGGQDATGIWNGSLSIKAVGRGNRGYLKGMLDEIRVWNVARTGTEISASYATDVDSNSPGLIGYWQFNDADQTITDASSSANHSSLGVSTTIGTDDPAYLDSSALLTESCPGSI